ncbi:MAG: signal peptidase I [Patescibacteria group bacterium]
MVKFFLQNFILILALIIAFVFVFLYNFTNVEGISMQNSLYPKQKLITDIYSKDFKRKDIIIFFEDKRHQGFVSSNLLNTLFQVNVNKRQIFVKRIIGIPGDKIDVDKKDVYINGVLQSEELYAKKDWICSSSNPNIVDERTNNIRNFVVPEKSYFVMGDNRGCSKDSRVLGAIPEHSIIGRVVLKLF